jgi:BirA family biotin operon repressor/biotin-[acetyl-CoA-carboxylase] ligase
MNGTATWRVEAHDVIASTSDLCVARARAGEADRLAVIAAQQTGGRGRAGRQWVSPAGNLYASVLLRPATPAVQGGLWALLAGLALIEALDAFAAPEPGKLTLKWPNDVLRDDAKLAGILLDAAVGDATIDWLVMGFGANLAHVPDVPGRRTAALAAPEAAPSPEAVLERLLARIDRWQDTLAADGGAELRASWLARAHPIGSRIAVDGGRIRGEFAGIDADGSLLLRDAGGVRAIRTGEVAVL